MNKKCIGVVSGAALVVALSLNSCDTPTGQGAGYGAAAGAIIGGAATGHVRGAAVGAAIGAASGALIGAAIEQDQAARYGPPPQGGYPYSAKPPYAGYAAGPIPGNSYSVPVNAYFALGDNSYNSYDSRYWGGAPEENLVGRGLFVYWPFNPHWGLIR